MISQGNIVDPNRNDIFNFPLSLGFCAWGKISGTQFPCCTSPLKSILGDIIPQLKQLDDRKFKNVI